MADGFLPDARSTVLTGAARGLMEPQEPPLPAGPWTKQLKDFPSTFSETHIRERGHAAGAQKHFISGYKMFKAEKVLNIFLHTTSASDTIIKADVEASMSLAKRYPVHAVICQDGQVTKASCACKAGKDVIKEAAFTALPRKVQERPSLDDAACVARISLPIKECWTLQMPPNDPCVITLDEAQSLEETRGQSRSKLWHSERAKRITASQFGDIVKRKAAVNETFLRNIFSGTHGATHHMKAGLKNEAAALQRYQMKKRVQLFSVGLCVNPGLPMLGASPDGLVWDQDIQEYGLVEVKTARPGQSQQVCKPLRK
ncbi:hypothetical protein HPB47_018962 [Ixodes persulcatus]|uniref:Uncharacterized protein n=1 Tax=Ixodes persulcatus TaxID=34615 RepID=A0AC60QLX4_IXOPE|nr:hypothetical protein HPB47_018962 [Ixodes persulcatus]